VSKLIDSCKKTFSGNHGIVIYDNRWLCLDCMLAQAKLDERNKLTNFINNFEIPYPKNTLQYEVIVGWKDWLVTKIKAELKEGGG